MRASATLAQNAFSITLKSPSTHDNIQVHLQSHAVVDNVEAHLCHVRFSDFDGVGTVYTHRLRRQLRELFRSAKALWNVNKTRGMPEVIGIGGVKE